MKRYANYQDILIANDKIKEQTYQAYGKGLEKFEDAINFIIIINYNNTSTDCYKKSSENLYYAHVLYQYYELPISFRSCIALMEEGHYSDSFKLIRSLMENLVKIKYFYTNQDSFEAFEKNEKIIKFSKMFSAIGANDAYGIFYKQLSKFEHRNIGTETISLNQRLMKNSTINLIPDFNFVLTEVIINNLMYILYGYLNFATILFSYDEKLDDQNIKDWLKDQVSKHLEKVPSTKVPNTYEAWYKSINKIIQ